MIKEQNVIGVIQARMGSKRLPNKMMLSLNGYPIIDWVVRKVKRSRKIDKLVVAIPKTKKDDILYNHLLKSDVLIYRGSESDLVDRFYNILKKYKVPMLLEYVLIGL